MTSQFVSTFLTSAAASLVEFVEALTVVLAVGVGRGWPSALLGTGAALLFLLLLGVVFGPALSSLALGSAKFVVGTLLVLFGLRWLRKATRRAGGLIPLRDEEVAFRRHRQRIGTAAVGGWDRSGIAIAFQATALEGLEVIFIVVALGAGGSDLMLPASSGAFAAFVLVALLGTLLHRPLTRIPENSLKRLVGGMLAGLGTFWVGQGAGLEWPGEDLAIIGLGAAFLTLSALVAAAIRARGAA